MYAIITQMDVHMYVYLPYLLHMGAQRQVISHRDCVRVHALLIYMYIHSSVATYACLYILYMWLLSNLH